MIGKCIECGFNGDCISVVNDLCCECNEEIEKCLNCNNPCRSKDEQQKIFKRMGFIKE